MTTRGRLQTLIKAAEESFKFDPKEVAEPEPGLEGDLDVVQLQMRKACRLLEVASFLLDNRWAAAMAFYTVIIEASFVAMERSVEAYLLEKKRIEPEEFPSHGDIFREGAKAGLYHGEIGNGLADLWKLNRARIYYRAGISSRKSAETLCRLALEIHRHVKAAARPLRQTCCCPLQDGESSQK